MLSDFYGTDVNLIEVYVRDTAHDFTHVYNYKLSVT